MEEGEAVEDSGNHVKVSPTHATPKLPANRFQLKCESCDFRMSNPAFLENHTRVAHPDHDWYRCKTCNFFSATTQWMETHLSSESHQQHHKEAKSSESSPFEAYVEKVSKDGVIIEAITEAAPTDGDQKTEETVEGLKVVLVEEDETELEPPRKKRGRPKMGASTTCEYCGLVVSNATNLSVHVRRKHSKEYGYSCTLCNYNCVTKGDMDRHCITKKHVRRAKDPENKGNISSPPSEEPTTTEDKEVPEPMETTSTDKENDAISTKEVSAEEESQSSPKQSNYDSVTACIYCDFVAQSIPSLHLHVKRKHTKDFEYVCLACSYYALNSREMSRHANTEKHKQKSQKYLEQQGINEQKQSNLQVKDSSKVIEDNLNPDFAPLSLTEDSESSSGGNTETQSQNTADALAKTVLVSDMEQQSVTSLTEPDPPDQKTEAALSEAQPTAEVQTVVGPSSEKEDEKDSEKQEKDELLNSDATSNSSNFDVHISKVDFDASIVSCKTLAEQEQLQEGLEGEAAVICLTPGAPMPPLIQTAGATFVKKLKPKEMKTRDESGNPTRIRCEDCGFMADGISGLNVHISMKHPTKEKHFHCLVCGKSFYTESNLHQHLTSAAHLRNEQNSVEELPEGGASFKCVKCTERFESEQELFIHIKEKHEDLLREVNKYVLEDTEQINKEREENKGNVCKYCGKVCKSSNSMAFLAHIRTHTGMHNLLLDIK